ncbi:MAG: hypothetical protein PHO78_07915 [Methanomicrobium sp.]|nr:hypothetical protein [Methanomicrobium sp.]
MVLFSVILGASKFFILIILLPAIVTGLFSLLIYNGLTKIKPPVDRYISVVPVIAGLLLCVLITLFNNYCSSLLFDLIIISMGVLTSFMTTRRLFPDRFLYLILLFGSVIAVFWRFMYGFGMIFGEVGGVSPVFQLLTPISSSNEGFLILNSIALYLEMVLISALLFSVIYVVIKTFQKIVER